MWVRRFVARGQPLQLGQFENIDREQNRMQKKNGIKVREYAV
jgi:hypothetical protein